MEDMKLTIKAIAAQMNVSIADLAVMAGISPNHLWQVSAGNIKMLAEDVRKISAATGIPMENIETDYKK